MGQRLKKYLRRGAIALGVVLAILVLTSVVLAWIVGRQLEKRIAAIRAAGDPVTLADLARKPLPPDQNAAVILRRVEKGLAATANKLENCYGDDSLEHGCLKPSEIEAIQAVLEANPEVLRSLQQAADAPDYNSEADYTVAPDQYIAAALPRVGNWRAAYRVLTAQTLVLVSRKEHDTALQNAVTILRLCRHFDREPMIVAHLTSLACRNAAIRNANVVLRTGPLKNEARTALETELARHDLTKPFVGAIKSERPYALDVYRQISLRPIHVPYRHDACLYLELVGRHIELAAQPYSAVVSDALANGRASGALPTLAALAEPSFAQARLAMARTQARVRCLRVLNAIQAHAGLNDSAKVNLSQLGLPSNATIDPFDGQPLRIRKLPEGWTIYSVGENLQDDGGNLEKDQDVGLAPLPVPKPEQLQ